MSLIKTASGTNSNLAPVVLFVYNRPWHTQQTIKALEENLMAGDTDLIIFSDGPKSQFDKQKITEIRCLIDNISINSFKSVRVIKHEENLGLAQSIITGVTNVLREHESIIVLEDDMVTSPYFLTFMNKALEMYKHEEDVISIHGYIYPIKQNLPSVFFLKGADCWGWATWKRGWDLFEADGAILLKELKNRGLTYEFDFHGTYPYTRMLEKQIRGENSSWAIRWYASAFLKNKLTLYPGKSLVRNIGNDTSGTHSWDNSRFDQEVLAHSLNFVMLKSVENVEAKKLISKYFKDSSPSLIKKIAYRLKFFFK